jgi:hypothetical protein
VLQNDIAGSQPLNITSVRVVVAPLHGTAVATVDGFVLYTPAVGYYTADSFDYTVCSVGPLVLCSNAALVSVMISPVPPVVNGGFAFLSLFCRVSAHRWLRRAPINVNATSGVPISIGVLPYTVVRALMGVFFFVFFCLEPPHRLVRRVLTFRRSVSSPSLLTALSHLSMVRSTMCPRWGSWARTLSSLRFVICQRRFRSAQTPASLVSILHLVFFAFVWFDDLVNVGPAAPNQPPITPNLDFVVVAGQCTWLDIVTGNVDCALMHSWFALKVLTQGGGVIDPDGMLDLGSFRAIVSAQTRGCVTVLPQLSLIHWFCGDEA